jgi:hypothetical protein
MTLMTQVVAASWTTMRQRPLLEPCGTAVYVRLIAFYTVTVDPRHLSPAAKFKQYVGKSYLVVLRIRDVETELGREK